MIKLYLLALLIRLAKYEKATKKAFECYMLIFKEKIIIVRTSISIFAIILFSIFECKKADLIFF